MPFVKQPNLLLPPAPLFLSLQRILNIFIQDSLRLHLGAQQRCQKQSTGIFEEDNS